MVMKSESKRQLKTKDDLRHIGDIGIYIYSPVRELAAIRPTQLFGERRGWRYREGV